MFWLEAILGVLTSTRSSSRVRLDRQLRLRDSKLPRGCVQELADDAVRRTRLLARLRGRDWHESVTDHLDGAAINIAGIIKGNFEHSEGLDSYAEHLRDILRKHGVPISSVTASADDWQCARTPLDGG